MLDSGQNIVDFFSLARNGGDWTIVDKTLRTPAASLPRIERGSTVGTDAHWVLATGHE